VHIWEGRFQIGTETRKDEKGIIGGRRRRRVGRGNTR